MFLASENIPWEAQRIRLHNLASLIPHASRLPLLILSGSYESSPSTIVKNLGLNQVVPIVQSKQIDGIFSDENLRKALEWLATINDALDESIEEICDAAKSNLARWPCPEISLLDFQILESDLPSVGWSSASRIKPLVQALKNCKLSNDISRCSLTGI
ncbi:hypothetical protein L1987_09186 [Smallanthus sonchifolius]|uniref:Uncharacterized protein n=1 Tax=Smallanthus sonchifolius TaxID=185202 RepID=A0ACB9JMQ0_9ASTR|nr:hypothetical protein L1987_09186 [Smallanthus sonchifolius]